MKIRTGDVRFVADASLGRDPIRVLLADEHEVMYEAWSAHLREGRGDWGMRRLRSCIYHRAATEWLVENSQHIGHQPLDTAELAKHRPDLPLRLLRETGWNFDATQHDTLDAFERTARAAGLAVDALANRIALPLTRVWVRPLGPQGGQLPTVPLRAPHSDGFRALELLWLVHKTQAVHAREPWQGAGIYREGLSRGEPCYYIGPNRDLGGHVH